MQINKKENIIVPFKQSKITNTGFFLFPLVFSKTIVELLYIFLINHQQNNFVKWT